jgi:hypothetical protein
MATATMVSGKEQQQQQRGNSGSKKSGRQQRGQCYILEEIEWIGIVEVGRPLVCGWLGYDFDHSYGSKLVL